MKKELAAMTTTESYGCDKHGEDAYQGCAMCDLERLTAENEALREKVAAYEVVRLQLTERGDNYLRECVALRKDAEARSLYDRTAAAQGFTNAPHWNELAEETRQMYRDERAKRDAAMEQSHDK
jgi:hypothetical protein